MSKGELVNKRVQGEEPTPQGKLHPCWLAGLWSSQLVERYKVLYEEYVLMMQAYNRAGEHCASLEMRLVEVIKESDHWRAQYQLLARLNEHIYMPTEEERRSVVTEDVIPRSLRDRDIHT